MEMQGVYMSFVGSTGFLGACIVRVPAQATKQAAGALAIQEAWKQECNPGGEVMSIIMDDVQMAATDEKWFNRLLNRTEVEEWDNSVCAAMDAGRH